MSGFFIRFLKHKNFFFFVDFHSFKVHWPKIQMGRDITIEEKYYIKPNRNKRLVKSHACIHVLLLQSPPQHVSSPEPSLLNRQSWPSGNLLRRDIQLHLLSPSSIHRNINLCFTKETAMLQTSTPIEQSLPLYTAADRSRIFLPWLLITGITQVDPK